MRKTVPGATIAGIALLLAAVAATAATITVTTTADEYDSITPNLQCSLREAIASANGDADFGGCAHTGSYGADQIVFAAANGTYALTRAGVSEDADATGDLDIAGSLIIDGNGSTHTLIAAGNGFVDRIVHVLAGTVSLQHLAIQGGNLPNNAAGGGLRAEGAGTNVTLTAVSITGNSADGNAGGVLNRATMTINASAVSGNQTLNATQGGGGIFNDDGATLTINDSDVNDNTSHAAEPAQGFSGNTCGGGIYNDQNATLTINNSVIDGNLTDVPTGTSQIFGNGGGICNTSGTLTVSHSTISNNTARGNDAQGGGIYCTGATASTALDHAFIAGNLAADNADIALDDPGGGGIACAHMTIDSSLIDANEVAGGAGGGGGISGSDVLIRNSTISHNTAHNSHGGGILAFSDVVLVNTTVADDFADGDGGGIYFIAGTSGGLLLSTTITGNTSNADGTLGGAGGGVFVDTGAAVSLGNSVLAGNLENGVGNHDDCDGTITSLHHNWLDNPIGCTLSGADVSDLSGDARLGALADNEGPVVGATGHTAVLQTAFPQSDSGLIDHGDPAGCRDQDSAVLVKDERGQARAVDGPDPDLAAVCDTGAVEFQPVDRIFADAFE
jgi:CSLREA domain-containing protein